VILALLDARDLSLSESRGFSKLGLRDAKLLSERLKVQLDNLPLDPSCIGSLGLGGEWTSSLHFRPSFQLSVSHRLPPRFDQVLPQNPLGSATNDRRQ